MEIRDILLKLKSENGLTTDQLSQLSGVPKGTLNKLLNGETRNPTGETLKKIAKAFECSIEVFYTHDKASLPQPKPVNINDLLPAPNHPSRLLGEIAAGFPIYAYEDPEIVLSADSIRCDFALKVKGDSMIDARIYDGDIVFFRHQEDVDDGDIAAVILDDEATVKRIYHIKNGLQLVSMNPKYAPMIFTFDEVSRIRIMGKAVGFQSRL